ncbi:HIT domain-containing protein [Mucilaginibacter sp. KACC 22773]|uniref:HIT domain-containing protein n=1 Tax=Mucilaginibacter sp. KACC 22773 TaxID=3025671 RepID=UPI00236537EB|nr:HIT domain-containing protein [Mucilaginibacter sp. KACC 22773]WDF77334.1 HIT domain-containing protein [Mucilaginibacter sp. KACC 22773]
MTCSICNELLGLTQYNRFQQSNKFGLKNAFLYKDDHFCVIPSIGALENGHCLIVPTVHCNSLLNYVENLGKQQELHKLLIKMADRLVVDSNMTLLCFEHGSFSNEVNHSLCSTTHAHLHILPINNRHINNILQNIPGADFDEIVGINDIVNEAKRFNDYIIIFSFRDGKFKQHKVLNSELLPTQYIRKIIGNELKNNNWDWKVNNDNSHTDETIENFVLSVS